MAPGSIKRPPKRRASSNSKNERPKKRAAGMTSIGSGEYAFMGNKQLRGTKSISSPAAQPAAQKQVLHTESSESPSDDSEIQIMRNKLEKVTRERDNEHQKVLLLQATQLTASDQLEAATANVERLAEGSQQLRRANKRLSERNEQLEMDVLAKQESEPASASQLPTSSRASLKKPSSSPATVQQPGSTGGLLPHASTVLQQSRKTETEKLHKKHEVALADLKTERQKNKEISEAVKQVKADMSKLLQQIDLLTSEKEELTASLQKVQHSALKDRKILLAKIDQVEAKVASLTNVEVAKRNLEFEKIRMLSKISRLEEESAASKMDSKRTEGLQDKVDQLTQSVKDSERRAQELTANFEKTLNTERSDWEKARSKLTGEVEAKSKQINSLGQEKGCAETKIQELQSAQEADCKAIGVLQERLSALEANNTSLQQQIVDAQASQREAQRERDVIARDREQTNRELDDSKTTVRKTAMILRLLWTSGGTLPPEFTPENPWGRFRSCSKVNGEASFVAGEEQGTACEDSVQDEGR